MLLAVHFGGGVLSGELGSEDRQSFSLTYFHSFLKSFFYNITIAILVCLEYAILHRLSIQFFLRVASLSLLHQCSEYIDERATSWLVIAILSCQV